jgi:hypothetical protein
MCGTLSWTLAVVNGGNVGENRVPWRHGGPPEAMFHGACDSQLVSSADGWLCQPCFTLAKVTLVHQNV